MSETTFRNQVLARVQDRFFYGWVIVAVASLGIFASGPGQSHTFSVFVGPIGADLGIGSAEIASAYGLATLVAAFCLPYMGRLVDRFGPRRTTVFVVLGLGLACFAFGAAANFLWLAVCFGALRFLGQGSLMLNCANLVSQWFNRKRGFAMSLMALGFGVSMAIHPPLAQVLVDSIGWRQAWFVLGLSTWLIMLPPVLLLVFDRPEDQGLRPDGDSTEPGAGAASDGGRAAEAGLTLREALATPAFYLISLGMCALSSLVTALHFYQVTILGAQGLDAATAALFFPVSAVTMVLCMPLVGRSLDRFKTRYVFAFGLLVMASSLTLSTLAGSLAGAIAYALMFGLNNAFTMTLFGYIWPRYFGRKHLGSIQGTGQMIGVVGASLGPLPVGYAIDTFGTPIGMLRFLAIIPLVCAVLALFLRTPAGAGDSGNLE